MPFPSLPRTIKIFFSYALSAPQDKRLFEKLTAHLSLLRRQHVIDEWFDSAIGAGSTISQQVIETHLHMADIIVLLISADFFADERCYELEMKRALELSDTGAARLIPVLLSPADWSISPLDRYRPLPLNGTPVSLWKNRDDALSQVAKGIRRVVEELVSKTMGTGAHSGSPKFSPYAIPYRSNVFFTDRETILATLASSFASTQTPQTPILALNGMGGMGKTQIALTYIYHPAHAYQTMLWLNASTRTVLSTEVRALADQLSLPQDERDDEQRLFASVKRWLQDQPAWLLVLDQIEDLTLIDRLVPSQSHGHVLLTTRKQALGGLAFAVPLTSMENDASILFLLRRAGLIPAEVTLDQAPADTVREASALVEALDGFPLALDQAGAYLEETGCSLATYLDLYHDERATLLSQRGQLIDSHSHPDSVTSTLALAFEQVAQKRAANLDLLCLLAFLHPDAIPDELLTRGAPELRAPLRSLVAHSLTLYQALAELRDFSLIHHGADRTTLCIQRIVQTVLIDTLTARQQRQWANLAVRVVNRVFPEVSFDTWTECKRFLPQAQHCATLISEFQLTLKEGGLLLERLGTYCYRQAGYIEAETYLTQALQLYKRLPRANSPDVAQTLNSLALLYHRQARYQEAETLHQRALELREQALGPDHPQTAESLHNLAVLYGSRGQYQQAEQFYLRVLALDERSIGPDHPDTAKTLNNLGLMYYLQGHYPQAETAYRRVLAIYERSLPTNHPDLAYPLNSLGALYEKQGHYQPAGELYQRALAIREKTLGEKHPETAHSMNKVADIYESQGKYQQAEALYQRALTGAEQALGPDHPDVALFLNNLAFLADTQEQYQQAEPLYQRALSIYEQTLGAQHPVVASVLNNLGQLSRNTKNEPRAEAYLRRALAIREQALGTAHPDTAQSLSNLADLLADRHAYAEAAPLFQRALAMLLQAFGPEHPDVALAREKYTSLLERMQRSEET